MEPGSTRWVTCTQPLLFPPLYMIERFARCDAVVLMQEAQHSREAEHSWMLLTTPAGPQKVSLSCRSKNRRPIDQIEVLDLDLWCSKLFRRVATDYVKSPGYDEVLPALEGLLRDLRRVPPTLHMIARQTMIWVCGLCGLTPAWYDSKVLVPERPAEPTAWLAELSDEVQATDYLQGETSIRSYFQPGVFRSHGIRVWGQAWRMPVVPRRDPGPYNPRTSVLDTLLVAGPAWIRAVIGRGQGTAQGTVVRLAEYE